MKKCIHAMLTSLLAMILLAGCNRNTGVPSAATPTPTPTPTPVVTMEPTATPDLPEIDPNLMAFADVLALPWEEWPGSCAMRYLHASGSVVEAPGVLAQGEGFTLYLLQDLREKSFERFVLLDNRVLPDRQSALDTGEGMKISSSSGDIGSTLSAAIASSEESGYYVTARHNIDIWDELYGFALEPDRGSVAYSGEFAVLEHDEGNVRRLFALQAANGVRLVEMQVYEFGNDPLNEPTMFQYLCSMLASIRFQ